MTGRFIVLEGGEGAGKSTHAKFLCELLRQQGRKVVMSREPGGSPLAEAIRELVLRDWAEGIDPTTETLLMFAARAAHLQAKLLPALQAGQDVICDRFVDASYAYQGAGRGVPEKHLQALEHLVLGALKPDLVIVFDVDPKVGLARARRRGDENRFEGEALAFQERVRSAYLKRARQDPGRYVVVDAGREVAEIQTELGKLVSERL